MTPVVSSKLDQLAEICRSHHVTRLWLFGSGVRDDFDIERSDLDFLVEFDEAPFDDYVANKFSFEDSLAEAVGRRVDVVVRKWVENPYFLRQIEREKVLVYGT